MTAYITELIAGLSVMVAFLFVLPGGKRSE